MFGEQRRRRQAFDARQQVPAIYVRRLAVAVVPDVLPTGVDAWRYDGLTAGRAKLNNHGVVGGVFEVLGLSGGPVYDIRPVAPRLARAAPHHRRIRQED